MSEKVDEIGRNLTPKQLRAIDCLLKLPTVEQAAKCAGISKQTIYNWLASPTFKIHYKQAQTEIFNDGMATLKASLSEGVTAIRKSLTDPKATISNKITASKTLIELSLRSHETMELETRVKEIENQLERK